ncbi:MAG: histidine phosphatase family protein [Planctomycetes bacterium]|nr:histidine phosphatase family protein [Planctomycetota bacterium]
MELWLVRHADAGAPLPGAEDDARALTPRGRRQCFRIVRALAHLGAGLDHVRHSPLLRAVQTAEALVPALSAHGTTAVDGGLARAPDHALVARLAAEGVERMAIVGHEPWLGALAFWLASGWSAEAPERQPAWLELEKGGVLQLTGTLASGEMRLRAVYPRRALRLLARG